MPTRTVGCFEVVQLSEFRWKVTNTLTTCEHVTHASTEEEMVAQLEIQSDAWNRRLGLKKGTGHPGHTWRDRVRSSANEKAAKKADK